MQSWLEGIIWVGKGAQATGMTASLRILSSKADSNTCESFTRSGLKLESVHQESPHSDVFRKRATKPLLNQRQRQKRLTWAVEKKNVSVTYVTLVPWRRERRRHVGWPTKLGSRQRDQSTSSVTKRANGHWHAIIASSCRWSPCEYKRQQVHRINSCFHWGAEPETRQLSGGTATVATGRDVSVPSFRERGLHT